MKYILTIVISALTVGMILGQSSRQAEVQFKAAQHKEDVEGDYKGAISEYKRIASGKDPVLAAKATLRIADIYRKQSDAQAIILYKEILQRFPEEKEAV